MKKISYKDSGVDTEAGDLLVEKIQALGHSKFPHVLSGVGGFAALTSIPGMEETVLVSSTDGVGTKIKLACKYNKHDHIGTDLVAMCLNDIITCGAKPLFFLDYFATSKLDVDLSAKIISNISETCQFYQCPLIGGETAEMPGMYQPGEYDLAGFAVGVINKSKIIDGKNVKPGDIVIGLASNGLHSNGYSLARKALGRKQLNKYSKLIGNNIIDALMIPTRIYSFDVQRILDKGFTIKAMSHITGGGMSGNIPRTIPDHLNVEIDLDSFARPGIFNYLSQFIDQEEMLNTFNMGIGYVMVVDSSQANSVVSQFHSYWDARIIGRVIQDNDSTNRVQFIKGGSPID